MLVITKEVAPPPKIVQVEQDGFIMCSAKYNHEDKNLWVAIRYGVLNETSPLGNTEPTLYELVAANRDETLTRICQDFITSDETFSGLKARFEAHRADCPSHKII